MLGLKLCKILNKKNQKNTLKENTKRYYTFKHTTLYTFIYKTLKNLKHNIQFQILKLNIHA